MIKTNIVCFGDSLTFGYGVDPKITFASRLAKQLPEQFPQIQWTVVNSGINGDTTREGLERLDRDVLKHNPHIVILFLGSNDCALSEDQYRPMAEFQSNLVKITQRIQSHNNHSGLNDSKPVLLFITPPPMVDTDFMPFTTNSRLKEYSEKMKEIAKRLRCICIDFFEDLLAESNGKIEDYTQIDGIHLNKAGYDFLYERIHTTIMSLLDEDGLLKDFDEDFID